MNLLLTLKRAAVSPPPDGCAESITRSEVAHRKARGTRLAAVAGGVS